MFFRCWFRGISFGYDFVAISFLKTWDPFPQMLIFHFSHPYISYFHHFTVRSKYMDFFLLSFSDFPAFFPFSNTSKQSISCAISGSHFFPINIFPFPFRLAFFSSYNCCVHHHRIQNFVLFISGFVLFWPFASHYFRFYLIRKALYELETTKRYSRNSILLRWECCKKKKVLRVEMSFFSSSICSRANQFYAHKLKGKSANFFS